MSSGSQDGEDIGQDIYGTPVDQAGDENSSSTASSGATGGEDEDGGGFRYSLVFLALIACVFVLGIWLFIRRKRRLAFARYGHPTGNPPRDMHGAGGYRGRAPRANADGWLNWGRRRSADVSGAEGLNEAGEAPPPYMPKSRDEDGHGGERTEGGETENLQPAVPLQTLSREEAGLKPPGYDEVGGSGRNGPSPNDGGQGDGVIR